jgi:hypothetical protein
MELNIKDLIGKTITDANIEHVYIGYLDDEYDERGELSIKLMTIKTEEDVDFFIRIEPTNGGDGSCGVSIAIFDDREEAFILDKDKYDNDEYDDNDEETDTQSPNIQTE